MERPLRIVETVVDINTKRKSRMADKIIETCGGVDGKTIAILGVTFKPNTDDMRDSPSLDIVAGLQDAGATIRAYDPEGMKQAETMMANVTWCADAYETMGGADAVSIITEWNQFRALDLERAKGLLKAPVMIDLRNIYDPEDMASAGFTYVSVGRARVDGP